MPGSISDNPFLESGYEAHWQTPAVEKPGPLSPTTDQGESSPFAQQCGPNAKVWSVYQEKAIVVDDRLGQTSGSDLDTLLIIAGLFSAVVTTFVIEARKDLQPDPQATTNLLLQALLQAPNGSSDTFNPPPFKSPLSARLVAGLWFCSLFFSVVSALGASLGKSWLAEYAQIVRKPNAKDAYARHQRYIGLAQWHLVDVIKFLPVLLHTSFLLFACGLVVLLFGDSRAIGATILSLTTLAILLYTGTAIAPFIYPDCPFRTPLTGFLEDIVAWLRDATRVTPEESSPYSSRRDVLLPDSESRAEMLSWLHPLCHESADMDCLILAIAGLDREGQLNIQKSTSIETTLRSRLSSDDFELQYLKAYLHIMKNIGFWDHTEAETIWGSSINKLIRLMDNSDQAVQVTAFNFTKDICNDDFIREKLVSNDNIGTLFDKIYAPDVNVWCAALDCIQELCIYADFRAKFLLNANIERIVEKLGVPDRTVQRFALNWFKTLCKYDDFRISFNSIRGIEKVLLKIDEPDWSLRKTALDCVAALCVHADIASEFISNIAVKVVTDKLYDDTWQVRASVVDLIDALWAQVTEAKGINAWKVNGNPNETLISMLHGRGIELVDVDILPKTVGRKQMRFISIKGFSKLLEKFTDLNWHMQLDMLWWSRTLRECGRGPIPGHITGDIQFKSESERLLVGTVFQDHGPKLVLSLDCIKILYELDDFGIKISSVDGCELILKELIRENSRDPFRLVKALCDYDDFRSRFLTGHGPEKLLNRIDNPDGDIAKAALYWVNALSGHGDFEDAFLSIHGMEKLIGKLDDVNSNVMQVLALDWLKLLCDHDKLRSKFLSIGGSKKLLEKFDHRDKNVQMSVLSWAQVYRDHDDFRIGFSSTELSDRLVVKLDESAREGEMHLLASDWTQMLWDHDDHVIFKFFSIDGPEKLLARFDDIDGTVRIIALDAVTTYSKNGEFRSRFLSIGGPTKLVKRLDDRDTDVLQSVLRCIGAFCDQDDTRMAMILADCVQKSVEKLDHDWRVRIWALEFYKSICVKDDIRSIFILIHGVEKLYGLQSNKDTGVRDAANACVKALQVHGDFQARYAEISNALSN